MKNAFFCLWLGLCVASPAIAQDDADDGQPKPRGRVAWFVYTSMPEGLENPVRIMSGKDISMVSLSKRSPSVPVKIPQDGILRMVREVENPEDPGKPKYLTLAQAQVPDGINKALIILIPAAANPQGVVFHTKIQDLATFKGGGWLFLNMTKVRVAVEMGKSDVEIKPGEVKIHDAPELSEPVEMPIRYSYYHDGQQKWKMLSASTIVLYPTRREICIFGWDPKFDRIEKHGITFPVTQ